MIERLGRLLIAHRALALAVIAVLTAFFGYHAAHVRIESRTIDLFPATHPYVETFVKYSDVFGGASRVAIQLEVHEGDIFNRETLLKIRDVTKQVEQLPGVNNYQVYSIAQRKIKKLEIDAERGFRAVPIMWPDVPETPEGIAELKERIHRDPRIHGTLVSRDDRAALIVVGFFERELVPRVVYDRIEKIVAGTQDARTSLHVIGRPMLLGTILAQYPKLGWILFLTGFSILSLLYLYYRDVRAMLVPLASAVVAGTWGVGLIGLLGFNFDPLVIVVPFIVTARAISHSVQMVSRYAEHGAQGHSRTEAAAATFSQLFRPGALAIATDVVGLGLIAISSIPLLQKLAVMSSFWLGSILVSGSILSPLLLSFLSPNRLRYTNVGIFDRLLTRVAGWCVGGRTRWAVLAVALLVSAGGWFFAREMVIGDVHPGTPMLWPDAKYNVDTARIAERFRNTDELTVVVEGKDRDAIKRPEVLRTIEAFQRHMESIEEVGATSSIADFLPRIVSILHGHDPKWQLIPDDPRESGFFLEMIYSSSEPGDLTRLVTIDSRNANITVHLRDHKGETLRRVIAHAREFIDAHPVEGARLRLAGGYAGLLAAINEEVLKQDAQVTLLAFGACFLLCALSYRSLWAGLFFLVPLVPANWLTYAAMGALGIGLDVNALPVVAVGVGLGVDYGLYVVDRIREELQQSRDLPAAIETALRTAGKAVLFTAVTMVLGVAFWAFSFLRFQAEMGILLACWMTTAMLGGLVLLPTLVALLRPRFVVGVAEADQRRARAAARSESSRNVASSSLSSSVETLSSAAGFTGEGAPTTLLKPLR